MAVQYPSASSTSTLTGVACHTGAVTTSNLSPKCAVTRERPVRGCGGAGSAAKLLGKEPMEQLLPELIAFLLTHPSVKSMKQVGCLAVAAMASKQQK